MKLKLLTISLFVVNLVFASFFIYKWRHKYFDPFIPRDPFRESVFSGIKNKPGLIFFVGDSHTEGFELNEYLNNPLVRNRGIWGDVSENVKNRIEPIAVSQPKEVFIMIGVNDIIQGNNINTIVDNINGTVIKIRSKSPKTIIILESVLPTNVTIVNTKQPAFNIIVSLNAQLKKLSEVDHLKFLNLFPYFSDGKGMKKQYSFDGLHLNGLGYQKLSEFIKPNLEI